jgi:RNA polymerase sigma-70 factor (ECF subfamily)
VQNGPLGPQAVVKLAFLVARRLVAPEQAHDSAQDAGIKYQAQLLKEGPSWPERRARAWVWSVASNAARSLLRKRPSQSLDSHLVDLPLPSGGDPAREVAEREEAERRRARAWAILGALPRRDRELLTLRSLEARSWREIASILQENERTLRSRYSRLLKRLKARLVPAQAGEGGEEFHV